MLLNLQEWFDNTEFCDYRIRLVNPDGTERSLLVNKGLLITYCKYFRTMFNANMLESKEAFAVFEEFPGGFEYLSAIIKYIHGGVSTPMALPGVDHILMADAMEFLVMDTRVCVDNYMTQFVLRKFKNDYMYMERPGDLCHVFVMQRIRSLFAPRPVPACIERQQHELAEWMSMPQMKGWQLANQFKNQQCNHELVEYLTLCYPAIGTASKIHILRIFSHIEGHRERLVGFIMGQPAEKTERAEELAEAEFEYLGNCEGISRDILQSLVRTRACQVCAIGEGKLFLSSEYWETRIRNEQSQSSAMMETICRGCRKPTRVPRSEIFNGQWHKLCQKCDPARSITPVLRQSPSPPPSRNVKRKLVVDDDDSSSIFSDSASEPDNDDESAGVGLRAPPAPKKPRKTQ